AASRRFPVKHFTSDESAGPGAQHQALIHRVQTDAAGGADRLVDRTSTLEHQWQLLDDPGQNVGVVPLLAGHALVQQAGFDAGKAEAATPVLAARTRAARLGKRGGYIVLATIR